MPFRRGQLADVAKGSFNLAATFGEIPKTLSTTSLDEPSAALDMTTVYSRPPSSAAISLASPSGNLAWTLQGERGSMFSSPTMNRRHRSCGFSVLDDQHTCKDRFIVIRKGLGMLNDPNKMAVYTDLRFVPKHLTLNKKAYLVALDVDRLRQLGRGAGLSPIEAARSWIARECFCCRIMVPLRLPQSDVEITLDEAEPGASKHILLQVVLLSDPTDRREWCAVGEVVVVQRHNSVPAGLRSAIVDRSGPTLRKALETLARHEKEVAEYQHDLKRLKAEAQDVLQSLDQKKDLLEEQRKELPSLKLQDEWSFWFMSREEFLELDERKGGVPRCQELQAQGKLKPHIISLREALRGSYASDMAVFSHRWFDTGHPDKRNVKLVKAKEFLREHPCIRWLWCDWLCLPQGPDRTLEEQTYFDETLHNVMMLYLGLLVIIFFEAQYFGRFWPLLECWAAFQQPSLDGLAPNNVSGRSRAKFCCVCVAEGKDSTFFNLMKDFWGCLTVDEVREKLKQPEILVGNQRDKEVQVKVLRSLNKQVATAFSDLCKDCDRGFALRTACLDSRVMDYFPRRLQSDHTVLHAWTTGTIPPRAKSVCSCSFHSTTLADSTLPSFHIGMPVKARRHTNLGTPSVKFYAGTIVSKEGDNGFGVQYDDGDQDLGVPQAWLQPLVDQQSLTLSLVRHLSERPATANAGVDPPPKPPPRISHVGTDAPLPPLVIELGMQAHPSTSHAGIDAPLGPAVRDVGTDPPLPPKASDVGIDAPLQPLLKDMGTDVVEELLVVSMPVAMEPPSPPVPVMEPVPPQLSMSDEVVFDRALRVEEKAERRGCCCC